MLRRLRRRISWTRFHVSVGLLALLASSCGDERARELSTPQAQQPPPQARIVLTDEALARGLNYVNRSGEQAKRTILEANGAGVALLDLENDGDLDVVFTQGLPGLAALLSGPGADLEVFLNDGSGHFSRAPGPIAERA